MKAVKPFPSFKNKNVLILGLGLLGRGVKDAIFFAEADANVTVTDLKTKAELKDSLKTLQPFTKIQYTLGKHLESDILKSDLIIRNAGVPSSSPLLKLAGKNKIPVDMDEALFAEYCPCPIIGITGTRGKSTTTTLIYTLLKKLYTKGNVYLAGNIQGEATLPLIKFVKANDLVVLELSSWQLQGFAVKKISPHIAVFTNIYQDHMNSYPNMESYINDKKNIYKFQRKNDFCIMNHDNAETVKLASEVTSRLNWFSLKDLDKNLTLTMLGKHNKENVAAAVAVGKLLKLPEAEMNKIVSEFPGLEHRLEFVTRNNNVTFINDTTSTTPIAGKKALESIDSPIILIAGGSTKNLNQLPFAKAISQKVKAVILLEGSETDKLEALIKSEGGANKISGRYPNFEEAIKHAYALSLPGDTVLLSPGCASFGMFINEFDRGLQFKKIVKQL
ncbi:MAG: UDP-N-acetylmuramoylalanine-D-glutamate ligase [Parcubacteria group bacterium GW2011_GWC2_38_7]|nr:MAG: UDP-N-acetylmuramoylalanine-D-glutamate ligase [Parcubacteria group bacterium GW2011_GWC2_38_7]